MKFTLIALAAILMASHTARAQSTDRVITNNNDTILCKIKMPTFFYNWYKYSISDSGRFTKIKEKEIKEFYSADRKLWYRKIVDNKGRAVLMRVLERGPISLYEAVVQINNGTATNWYATKNSDTAIFIKTDAFVIISGTQKGKKAFMAYLADNKPIHDRYIADDNPPIEEIQNLVHMYNAGREYTAPTKGQ